jgi:hypothetical protein
MRKKTMKVIKAKPGTASAKIHSLMKPEGSPPERVLVVYGEGEKDASIYYEPAGVKPAARP